MAVRAGTVALVALLLFPSAASAGTVSFGPELVFTGAPGERNSVTVRPVGTATLIVDTGAPITSVPGLVCTQPDPSTASCEVPGFVPAVRVELGDADDVGSLEATTYGSIHGGDGADTITVSTSATNAPVEGFGDGGGDVMTGAMGATVLRGGDGDDQMSGGPGGGGLVDGNAGDDQLRGSDQGEALYGGGGRDTIVGLGGDDTIDGDGGFTGSGADVVHAGAGNDVVRGGFGDDELNGDEGDDRLDAGPGDDEVATGLGRDRVDAGAGDDRVDAADPRSGLIACGAGDDTVVPGARARVLIDCEALERSVACPRGWRPRCTVDGALSAGKQVVGRGRARVARGTERAVLVRVLRRARKIVRLRGRLGVRLVIEVEAGRRHRRPPATAFSLHQSLL
jgi:Ca2+-binding RTX toxin-like protein